MGQVILLLSEALQAFLEGMLVPAKIKEVEAALSVYEVVESVKRLKG